ncbi:hypothetical protein EDC96DRAFT_531048 [Choanephora cucurbitarum]|nr:hypothetical protein EDC96DRAFT_531048 [Choanephora cucurbitarum]
MNDTWYAVTAFHAYAYTMACQVKYNPRYIPNFGHTDGEGCERFWSYLDGFVFMTRSMSARNRKLVITDAVDHFAYNKMLELPKQIKQKKKNTKKKKLKIYESQLEKVDTKKTIEEWQKTQDLLTTKITKKFVKKLYEKTEKETISSKPFLEYLAAKK